MCGKLPCTLALFAVLGPVRPRTIKPFLPSFLSWRHSREKRYQALSRFTVLKVMVSWAGPGNKAMWGSYALCKRVKYSWFTQHVWAPPVTQVLSYSVLNTEYEINVCNGIMFVFHPGLPHVHVFFFPIFNLKKLSLTAVNFSVCVDMQTELKPPEASCLVPNKWV